MPFEFRRLDKLPELVLIEPRVFTDERGWFAEGYKRSDFEKEGIGYSFPQDNQSYSQARGTLRGLHFQRMPAVQGKLVRCLVGEVLDVAVDIRVGSPTYGEWEGVSLSAEKQRILWIPPGFAHGFQTLTDDALVWYKVTCEYSALHERSIRWDDPTLRIKWPLQNPVLSEKDRKGIRLSQAEVYE